MDIPAVRLLLLEQGDCSLEDHSRDFLDLACGVLVEFGDELEVAGSPLNYFLMG